jgi:hypothetical protein
MSETTRVDRWIDELTAKTDLVERDATEWDAVLRAVVTRLIEADSWPGVEGSPWLVLDEIAHRTLAPAAGARRSASATRTPAASTSGSSCSASSPSSGTVPRCRSSMGSARTRK